MLIKKALILSGHEKTDDELKAIMATHPSPFSRMIYGFYKSFGGTWAEYADGGAYDAIWVDLGVGLFTKSNWIVEGFHTPGLMLDRDDLDYPSRTYRRRKHKLEEQFWDATVKLIVHQIPDKYQAYTICYGEIEDEFEDFEAAWRESLLRHLNHAPEVKAPSALVRLLDALRQNARRVAAQRRRRPRRRLALRRASCARNTSQIRLRSAEASVRNAGTAS